MAAYQSLRRVSRFAVGQWLLPSRPLVHAVSPLWAATKYVATPPALWSRGFAASPPKNNMGLGAPPCACPTLGGPQPGKVLVEYDHPDQLDTFIAMADAIEEEYPDIIVEGNPDGLKGRKDSFEVLSPGGALLFSALASGRPPSSQELLDALESEKDQAKS